MAPGMKAARVVGMALVVGVATVGAAIAQSSGSEARTVEGTWYVQVTPIICATGAPVPGVPPVNALQTFHAGRHDQRDGWRHGVRAGSAQPGAWDVAP